MTFWESDRCLVPLKTEDQSVRMKLGNAGAGKAARPSRDSKLTPTTPSGGSSVLDRLERITNRAKSHPQKAFNNVFTLLNYELLWKVDRIFSG